MCESCRRVAGKLLENGCRVVGELPGIVGELSGNCFGGFGVGELSVKSWRAVGELLAPRGGGRRESCERVAAGGGRIVEEFLESYWRTVKELLENC